MYTRLATKPTVAGGANATKRPLRFNPLGRLQVVENLAGGTEGSTGEGDSGASDVPAKSLPFILLMPLTAHAGVE